MTKRIFLAVFFSVVFFSQFSLRAQVNAELINSSSILFEGKLYYLMGKYAKAASVYEKVSRNDTNYAEVQRDLALAYSDDGEDSLCAVVCQRGLKLKSEYTPDFYNLLGISLKEKEKYDTALKVFDEGIRLYPNSYLMCYQKGMVYYKMKKYQDAQTWFQKAIERNPYHASSHFQLGKTCAEQGRLVPAVLSYEYYLMLDPSSERAQKVTSAIEDLFAGDYQADPDLKLEDDESGDKCFSDIRDLIESKMALSPSYKNRTKINLKMVKHFQAVTDKLHYESGTGNWWMENYVPFFIAVRDEQQFVPFTCLSLYAVAPNNPQVYKVVKKNKKKIAAFSKWAVDYIKKHMKHPAAQELSGDKENLDYVFYENNMLAGVGHSLPNEKPTGEWVYFYSRGGRVLSRGSYNSMGQREGEWKWFYPDGTLKEKTNYVKDKREGVSEVYHESGKLRYRCTYKNDLVEGEYEFYALHGGLTEKAPMKADKLNGTVYSYFSNGTKRAELNYLNGKLNGEISLFNIDGSLYKKYNMLNEKRNGHYTEYYTSGKIKSEGEYKLDDRFGAWKKYWDNGKVLEEGTYKDKELEEGTWKTYYRDGTTESERIYKSGKLQGVEKLYDTDGKIYNENTYASGRLKKSVYYDKSGKTLGDYTFGKVAITVTEYHPNGEKAAVGDYEEGVREGDWKMYSSNGGWLKAKQHYRSGYLSGTRTEFYPNGKEESELDYSYGERDGYLKSYYPNGSLESEGWIVRDEREGDWYFYNERGLITSHRYYVDDDLQGYQEYFDNKGRKNEELYLKENLIWERTRYDSTGAVIYKYVSDNGTGVYDFKFGNNQSWIRQEYKNGYLDGKTSRYTYSGVKALETEYLNGQQHGKRSEFYELSGKPYIEGNFAFGDRHGAYVAYYENGNKRWEENYYAGDLDGAQKFYHENGQLSREANWDMGTVTGEMRYYSDDGSLQIVRYYQDGNLMGYSYLDKDGKLVPMIKLEHASGKVMAYYQNGNKSLEGEFENGKMNGHVVEYYPDGKIAEDENYVFGDYDGVQKYYYHNGNLHKELNYYSDELDGASKIYYENGQPERTEYYVLGSYWGVWQFYNTDGSLKMTRTYYDSRTLAETVPPPPAPASTGKGSKPAKK